jgi:hypothetical protein
MKQLLLLFLLCPMLLVAQPGWTVFDTLPQGAVRIGMPQEKFSSGLNGNPYLIRNDAEYKALFADSVHALLPVIDFERYELRANTRCMQCFTSCERPQCHRNACRYTRLWFLVDKQMRITVAVDTLNGTDCRVAFEDGDGLVCETDSCLVKLRQNCPTLAKETIDLRSDVVLARTAFVDCAATVSHEIYLDTVNRCMVWRMFIDDGGCHGMKIEAFIFSAPQPPAGYRVVFEEYSDPERY